MPDNAVAPAENFAKPAQADKNDKKSIAEVNKGANPLAKVATLVLVPVVAIVAIPVALVAAPIMYIRNPFVFKSLKRDLHFVKAISINTNTINKIKAEYGGEYTVADFWKNIISTKVKNLDKIFMTFLDKKVEGARVIKYKEMEESSNRIAHWALSIGITKGETIALMMNNQPEFIMVWLGMCKIGVCTAFVNPAVQGKGLEHALAVVNAKILIYASDCQPNVATLVGGVAEGVPTYMLPAPEDMGKISGDNLLEFAKHPNDPIPRSVRAGVQMVDPVFCIYTSGTTGPPKAAVINHMKFFGGSVTLSFLYRIKTTDVIYITLPLSHSSANSIGVGMTFFSGLSCVVRRKFSASLFFEDCAKYNATLAQYIGELCRYLVNTPPSKYDRAHKLRLMIGNGLRPEVWKPFVERFQVKQVGEFYASTEGNANFFNCDNTFGSVGCVSKLMENKMPVRFLKVNLITGELLRDPKTGFCMRCDVDEPGECVGLIDMSNPNRRFDGYSDKKATQKKILTNVLKEGDMYFRTGDILTKDARGNVRFADRIGDTFRWKGENVSTTEVTQIVSVVAGVAESNVYGAAVANHDGRAGMVAITFAKGVTAESFDWSALVAECGHNLPAFARPVFVRLTPAIEITGTFKHKKVELRNEGANPSMCKDELYYFNSAKKEYVTLTQELYEQIERGEIKI